jgi:hypothetical protein
MQERKKLSDILRNSDRENLDKAWAEARTANEFGALPGGEYIARIIEGTASTAKTGTHGYKLTFQVLEGEHSGRRFWHDVWLTPAAMPMAKRDLGKLGVTSLDQLDNPLPPRIRCRVKLALRKDDDANEYNRVHSFEVLGIDPPEHDAFAPCEEIPNGSVGDASEHRADRLDQGSSPGPYAEGYGP